MVELPIPWTGVIAASPRVVAFQACVVTEQAGPMFKSLKRLAEYFGWRLSPFDLDWRLAG